MIRLLHAVQNSARAFRRLLRREAAFQQEAVLFLLALPAGWWLAPTWRGYALLLGALLVVVIVEVLNTAIEAACNTVTREFRSEIQFAKDCGSLAVALSILLALVVWGLALAERLGVLGP